MLVRVYPNRPPGPGFRCVNLTLAAWNNGTEGALCALPNQTTLSLPTLGLLAAPGAPIPVGLRFLPRINIAGPMGLGLGAASPDQTLPRAASDCLANFQPKPSRKLCSTLCAPAVLFGKKGTKLTLHRSLCCESIAAPEGKKPCIHFVCTSLICPGESDKTRVGGNIFIFLMFSVLFSPL